MDAYPAKLSKMNWIMASIDWLSVKFLAVTFLLMATGGLTLLTSALAATAAVSTIVYNVIRIRAELKNRKTKRK